MEIKIVIDDRVVRFARKLVSRRALVFPVVLSVALPVLLYAEVPHVFEGGQPISASAVNEDFSDLDARVGVYEEALSVDDKGNVGVGVQDPSADLNIQGNKSLPLTGTVAVNGGSTVLNGTDTHFTAEVSVGDAILVDDEVFTISSITSDTLLELDAPHSAGATNAIAYTDSDLFAVQSGDGVEKFVIDKSGNVGIRTTSPVAPLHVLGCGLFGNLRIGSSEASWKINPGAADQDQLGIANDGGYLMVIGSSGNVGIGTTTPSVRLDVRGDANLKNNGTTSLGLNARGMGGRLWNLIAGAAEDGSTVGNGFGILDNNANSYRFVIAENGDVGIGTTDPQALLHVAGTIQEDSDARLKVNVKPIQDALARLLSIDGVSFEWKERRRGEGTQLGVIAQDVEMVFPELVRTDEQGYMSVNYGGLAAPIIEAIREQQVMIDQQNETILDQRGMLREQQSIIQQQRESLKRVQARVDGQEQELAALRKALEALEMRVSKQREESP